MKKQYFYNKERESMVYTIDFFNEMLNEEKETEEILLYEVTRDIGGPMWCDINGYFVSLGDCGSSECEDYEPCNGKSGRCKFLKNGFKDTGKKFILTEDGLEELIK